MSSYRIFERLYILGNEVRKMEMRCMTSIGIGGEAIVVDPPDVDTLIETVKFLKDEGMRFRVMGMGTNLLVSDSGLDGVVLRTLNLTGFEVLKDRIVVESGMPLKRLIRIALSNSLSGLEELYGIPGSVGGAVRMNAGAYGKEIKDVLEWVELFDGKEIERLSPGDLGMSYRNGNLGERIVTRVSFILEKGDPETIGKKMLHFLEKRLEKQPIFEKSAGSVFKRPREDFYVGMAIEELGLKGFKVGGVKISEKHAGFMINTGGGTFDDAMKLINIVRERVKKKYGVDLEAEIVVWE